MPDVLPLAAVLVDLKTTGATATHDRLTEIGQVKIDAACRAGGRRGIFPGGAGPVPAASTSPRRRLMTEDELEHEKERTLENWRPRWVFFSVVWVLLVGVLAAWLHPAFTDLLPHELLLVAALVAVIPPALDYFFSLAIADVMERRVHKRP